MGSYDRDEPTIADVLAMHADALRNELHTAMPAKVNSYNKSKQTVDVTPLLGRYLPLEDGGQEFEPLPQILSVPVAFPRVGRYGMTFPIEPGEIVMLVFSQFPLGTWKTTGAEGQSGDTRTHTLDGATAYLGVYPESRATAEVADDALVVFGDKVHIGAAQASHPMALGDIVKQGFADLRTWLQTHTHLFVGSGTVGVPTQAASLPPTPEVESQKHKLDG